MITSITVYELIQELRKFKPHQKVRFMFIDSESENGDCLSYGIQEVDTITIDEEGDAALLITHEYCEEPILTDNIIMN